MNINKELLDYTISKLDDAIRFLNDQRECLLRDAEETKKHRQYMREYMRRRRQGNENEAE
ncbi:hypothetical protein DF3PA_70106 [Candidatus Defluviicoccus seviourii]|uniref:Uncharacterized protein n=1 Tax=Candidatus Defluviicoccus seviourii TaxID=2565273 RepID=A0A564WH48_9PROT|nr:hypothetical protein DF3PA_70106 [Candidatus Defluviicoccus seviourii]